MQQYHGVVYSRPCDRLTLLVVPPKWWRAAFFLCSRYLGRNSRDLRAFGKIALGVKRRLRRRYVQDLTRTPTTRAFGALAGPRLRGARLLTICLWVKY